MPVRDLETLQDILDTLETNCGDLAGACSGVCSTGWLKRWMRDDPKVEAAVKDAMDTGAMGLESAAIQRAVHGVEEDVYYRDEVIGKKRKYSDTLLVKMLESRKPETYGRRMDVNTQITVTNLSDAELDKKIAMLSARLGLPAPEQTIDAEFSVVEPEPITLDDLL